MSADAVQRKDVLDNAKVIAVVGLSNDPTRASNRIGRYLQQQGYQVVPVNPNLTEVLGEKCYPDLQSIPVAIDLVDVFRRSEAVYDIVKAAQEKGVPVVWTQVGVHCDEESQQLAQDNNMTLIENACIMVEHRNLCK
ncbi:MAG: CoA-binding protein [Syntrophomonadaceae bacterium]|jgi:predicted CoA-binding protein|nr:CoA-binding protein [Bacillota bacterium]NLP23466.1 CoA-binding protein [Syntrophomonadaceae bacterium]